MAESFALRRLAAAGKRVRAAAAAPLPVIENTDPLGRVAFASVAAETLARDQQMVWLDFGQSAVTPSGRGGYTVADVRRVLAELGAEP